MRIFYAADHQPMPGNDLWHNNLYLPLVDLGHEVIAVDYDLTPHILHADPSVPGDAAFIAEHQSALEEALVAQVEAAHRERPVELLFTYFYSAFCRPEVIRHIRDMGICTMNWYCNGSYQFHLVEEIAPAYDFCLVPEKFRLDDYRRVGANPIYCQEAANPAIYKPHALSQEYDVTFVGQKYGDRTEFIGHLLRADVDVRVWGPGWSRPAPPTPPSTPRWPRLRRLPGAGPAIAAVRSVRSLARRSVPRAPEGLGGPPPAAETEVPPEVCGPPLTDDELIRMYSRSRISLGFSSCGETHRSGERVLQVRLRDFEAPMSGAFYMVEYMDELQEFFEDGKEIVCYHDKHDLAEKAKFYLSHDAERERIRWAGHRRAVGEHTWQQRFRRVFREVGLA